MTLLVDTSVIVKWFHDEGESEVAEARSLLQAHRDRRERIIVLDLTAYELGNVLLRGLHLPAPVVTQQLRLVLTICGPLVHARPSWLDAAADLGERYGLSFYDSIWVASAQALQCPLVSADRQLLAEGLAVTAGYALTALSST